MPGRISKILQTCKKLKPTQKVSFLVDQDSSDLRSVLLYAMNPYWVYNVAVGRLNFIRPSDAIDEIEWKDITYVLDKLKEKQLSGQAGIDELNRVIQKVSPEGADLIFKVLVKDLDCGLGIKTINKAFLDLIPEFEVMKAEGFETFSHRVKYPVAVETKFNGVRAIYSIQAREFRTRNGQVIQSMNWLALTMVVNRDYGFIDGEIICGTLQETAGAMKWVKKQATDAIFHPFDCPENLTLDQRPYTERREELLKIIPNQPGVCVAESWTINSEEEVKAKFEEHVKRGLEGVVVKDLTSPYQQGRHPTWLKLKKEQSMTVTVLDCYEGEKKYVGKLGGFVALQPNGKQVKVGGGFDDAQRASFWNERMFLRGRKIDILYHELTPKGVAQHPRFSCFRDDIDED